MCPLCTISGDVVYEDAHAYVVLHEDWSPRGHAMVVARRHVENASDLDEGEWLHLTSVWHRAERVLLDATGAERAMILKLGIMTPHLHVHIYPAFAHESREEVFGAFEGRRREDRDEGFVGRVRDAMKG